MNRMWRTINFFPAFLLAGMLALHAAPVFSQGQFPPFLMELQTDRDEYWKGEPILVRGRVMNWLSRAVQMETYFGFQSSSTEFYVVQDGVWKEPYRSWHQVDPVSDQTYMMQYAKAHEFVLPVLYDPEKPDFLAMSESGEYQFRLVQAVYYMNFVFPLEGRQRRVIEAFSPVIKVVDPPPQFAGALEMLRSRPSTFLDLNRQQASPGNREIFETLLRQYPESRYAPYALHALAGFEALFIRTHYEFREKTIRLYQRLVDEYPDYPLRDSVRILLAELYQRNGDLDKAVQIVYALIQESGDNLYRFRKSFLTRALRKTRDNPFHYLPVHCWELFGTTELTDAGFQMAVEPDYSDTDETAN